MNLGEFIYCIKSETSDGGLQAGCTYEILEFEPHSDTLPVLIGGLGSKTGCRWLTRPLLRDHFNIVLGKDMPTLPAPSIGTLLKDRKETLIRRALSCDKPSKLREDLETLKLIEEMIHGEL